MPGEMLEHAHQPRMIPALAAERASEAPIRRSGSVPSAGGEGGSDRAFCLQGRPAPRASQPRQFADTIAVCSGGYSVSVKAEPIEEK